MKRYLIAWIVAAMAALAFGGASAQVRVGIPLPLGGQGAATHKINLGKRQAGQTYPLDLNAQNQNCEQLLDFRFEANDAPWLTFPSGNLVTGVAQGQTKPLAAMLDLTNVKPGHYSGQVEVSCENCGWFIFANCKIDKQMIRFDLDVVPAPNGARVAGQQQQQPRNNVDGPQAEPRYDESMLTHLTEDKRRPVEQAHRRLRKAVTAARWTDETLQAARKKKSDCEKKLAALKAAADAAVAAANSADAAARTAAARAAQAQKDLDAAERAMDDTYRTLQRQAAYRSIVRKEDGTGSARYKDANDFVNKANDAAVAAQRRYTALKKTVAPTLAAAKAKKAAAARARAKANAAIAAYNAKARQCSHLAQKAAAAQHAKNKADQHVKAAAAMARDAEAKARVQAAAEAQRCRVAVQKRQENLAHIQTQAFRALKKLGFFTGAKYVDIDIESTVKRWALIRVLVCVAKKTESPYRHVFVLLNGLQAAYRAVGLWQELHIPGRSGLLTYDSLRQWLWKKGYANKKHKGEADKIIAVMERIVNHEGNLDFLRQTWRNELRTCCPAPPRDDVLREPDK